MLAFPCSLIHTLTTQVSHNWYAHQLEFEFLWVGSLTYVLLIAAGSMSVSIKE